MKAIYQVGRKYNNWNVLTWPHSSLKAVKSGPIEDQVTRNIWKQAWNKIFQDTWLWNVSNPTP